MIEKSKKQQILVLGGTGFIGQAFINELMLSEDDFHLHMLVRTYIPAYENSLCITQYVGDLTTFDWSSLLHSPDIIYHFARINATKNGREGRIEASLMGKKANVRLLNFLSNLNNEIKVFYLSGSLMYGNSNKKIDENSPLVPISFAREYITAEMPFLEFQKIQSNLKITMIRVPWVLGNGSWFQQFYLNPIFQQKLVFMYGKGINLMSFILLEDLVKCLLEIQNVSYKKTINLSYPDPITQQNFVNILSRVYDVPVKKKSLWRYQRAIKEAFLCNIILISNYSFFENILNVNVSETIAEYLLKQMKSEKNPHLINPN